MADEGGDGEKILNLISAYIHDIKNPLTSASGFLSLFLEEERLSPDQRSDLEVVRKNMVRVAHRVDDIITILRGLAGIKYCPDGERLDIYSALDEAILDIQLVDGRLYIDGRTKSRFLLHKGEVYRTDGKKFPVHVFGDRRLTRMVFSNLLANALIYGESLVEFGVEAVDGGLVRCMVANDCEGGIPEEHRGLLFQPYCKIPGREGGSGTGLYVSRELARQQGGDLWIESDQRVVRAYFTLPTGKE